MAQIKSLVFALTPRGGRKHHVFLFPEQAPARAVELAAAVANKVEELLAQCPAAQAREGIVTADFFLVGDEVVQPTTSRRAHEWICLLAGNLQQLDGKVQAQVLLQLKTSFEELQKWISTEPDRWDRVRGESIRCPVLSRSQEELEKILPKNVLFEVCPDSSPTDTPKVFRRVPLMVVLGLGLVMGLVAFGQFFPWPHPRPPFPWPQPPQPTYAQISQALGLPPSASADQVVAKLRSILLWNSTEEKDKSQNRSFWKNENFEAEILKYLVLVDQKVNKVQYQSPPRLEDLAKYDSLRLALEKLFPRERGRQFDPLGIIRADGDDGVQQLANWCEGLNRLMCLRLLCTFSRLNNIPPEIQERIKAYLQDYVPEQLSPENVRHLHEVFFFAQAERVRDACKSMGEKPLPLFFVPDEKETLACLRDLLMALGAMCLGRELSDWREFTYIFGQRLEDSPVFPLIKEARASAERATNPELAAGWRTLADVLEEVHRQCQSLGGSR